jgi:hypothetical protein
VAQAGGGALNRELLRRKFPHIAAELEEDPSLSFSSFRSDPQEAERATFEPTAVDFIRRCDTEEEALEIIDFLESRKEIAHDYADKLRRQLKERGLRSFGPKKKPGYYFTHGI